VADTGREGILASCGRATYGVEVAVAGEDDQAAYPPVRLASMPWPWYVNRIVPVLWWRAGQGRWADLVEISTDDGIRLHGARRAQ
jgi:hypothetical protein